MGGAPGHSFGVLGDGVRVGRWDRQEAPSPVPHVFSFQVVREDQGGGWIPAATLFGDPGGRRIFEGRTKVLRAAAPPSRDTMPPWETPLGGQEPRPAMGPAPLATLSWVLGTRIPRNSFAA